MLYNSIEEHARLKPNKVALVDGSISLSYRELYSIINQYGLLIKDDINHMQLVGILLPNSLNAILSLLSIPLSGNIAVPIDTNVKQRSFDLIINGNDMIYSIDINVNEITIAKIVSDLYLCNDFTLTVNTVNDAPVLLQPFEDLEILGDSGAAAVVLSSI